MNTPEQLLSDRGWRRRNSGWMLWGILSLGILACVGFLYTGLRMRDPLRIIMGFFGLLLTIASLAVTPPSGEPPTALSSTLTGVMVMWWIGSSSAAFFMNRAWLIWKANRAPQWPEAPAPTAPAQTAAQQYTAPQQFAAAPSAQPQYAQPQYAQSGLLDLNSASREQLLALPGINAEWADYLIAAREKNGGFDDKNELVIDAQMPPHMYLQIRDLVTVTPRMP